MGTPPRTIHSYFSHTSENSGEILSHPIKCSLFSWMEIFKKEIPKNVRQNLKFKFIKIVFPWKIQTNEIR